MKLLMLGATGAIGKEIVELIKNNEEYTVTVTSRVARNSSGNIKYIVCDAMNLNELKTILNSENWDVIVDFMAYTTAQFEMRIDEFLNNTRQYVFLSSARVYSQSSRCIKENSTRLIDENNDREYLDTDEYGLAKGRSENLLFLKEKKNWTVIRPYITCSNNRLQLGVYEKEDWLYRALKGRTIVFDQYVANKFTTLTSTHDLAIRIIKLFNNKKSYGEVYQIATNQSIKWHDILEIYCEVIENFTGVKPKVLLTDTLKNGLVTNKWQLIKDRYFDRKFDSGKINDLTGINEFTEMRKCLYDYMAEFIKMREFREINWEMEAKKDILCREHAGLKEIKGLKNKVKYLLIRYFHYKQ